MGHVHAPYFEAAGQAPRITFIAATDGRYGGAMAVGDGIGGLRASQIHLDIKTLLTEWITQLRAFKPNIVIGYPSTIKILTELADRSEGTLLFDDMNVIEAGPGGKGMMDAFNPADNDLVCRRCRDVYAGGPHRRYRRAAYAVENNLVVLG